MGDVNIDNAEQPQKGFPVVFWPCLAFAVRPLQSAQQLM